MKQAISKLELDVTNIQSKVTVLEDRANGTEKEVLRISREMMIPRDVDVLREVLEKRIVGHKEEFKKDLGQLMTSVNTLSAQITQMNESMHVFNDRFAEIQPVMAWCKSTMQRRDVVLTTIIKTAVGAIVMGGLYAIWEAIKL